MHAKWIALGATGLALVIAGAAPPSVFDKPVSTKIVPLPPDTLNPHAKPRRTCWYYPAFVAKQTDLGEKGAAELSITPVKNGTPPACTEKIAGEVVLQDWFGYYMGAKGPFVFFDADDGFNGLPFAVFSAMTGKKLFKEARMDAAFAFVSPQGKSLVLRYQRAWLAPCSLPAEGKSCWKKIVMALGLGAAAQPDCTKGYEYTDRTARSVIGYPVEARYSGGKLVVKSVPGNTECIAET